MWDFYNLARIFFTISFPEAKIHQSSLLVQDCPVALISPPALYLFDCTICKGKDIKAAGGVQNEGVPGVAQRHELWGLVWLLLILLVAVELSDPQLSWAFCPQW